MNDLDRICFHVYSDGKRADIPFGSVSNKVYAMNAVAIVARVTGVTVLSVNVNDTHLHCVIYGTRQAAEAFRRMLKGRIARHFTINGMSGLLGGGFFLMCVPINDREEVLGKIIYTFRNCLDHFNKMPWDYRWGVGNLYFARNKDLDGQRIGDLSYRKMCRLFYTEVKLPAEWLYDGDGMILPACYVDYAFVEKLFGSPRAFIAFLFVRKEDEQRMKQQLNERYLEARSIEELRKIGNYLSVFMFGRPLRNASFQERLDVAAKMLKDGTAVKSESLAKAVFLTMDDLCRLL